MVLARPSRHQGTSLRSSLLLILAAALLSASPALAQDDSTPAANPARPTVTNPATLPPVGYLQFEQGYLGSVNSPGTASQYGINQVTKLAVHPRLMFEAQFQPFATSRLTGSSQSQTATGDILVGPQFVLFAPSTPEPPADASKTPADASKKPTPRPRPAFPPSPSGISAAFTMAAPPTSIWEAFPRASTCSSVVTSPASTTTLTTS